jgi:hypothetical protein
MGISFQLLQLLREGKKELIPSERQVKQFVNNPCRYGGNVNGAVT